MLFVVWRSVSDATADIAKSLDAETTGFLVAESDSAVMLALNHQMIEDHLEMVGETITIPKEAIVSRKELRMVAA